MFFIFIITIFFVDNNFVSFIFRAHHFISALIKKSDDGAGNNLERKFFMQYGNIMKLVGLATLAIGFATSAHAYPYQFYQEETAVNYGDESLFWHFGLDFTATSANPANNFLTFTNPRSTLTVKYHPLSIVSLGGCYEIHTTGASGSDPIISVQNQAGTWTWLADDNGGNGQFWARVYLKPSGSNELRISQYSNGNTNDQLEVYVRKVKADPDSVITAHSCRLSGTPFWQYDQNSGNPYSRS